MNQTVLNILRRFFENFSYPGRIKKTLDNFEIAVNFTKRS